MTKKDYKAIARAFNKVVEDGVAGGSKVSKSALIVQILGELGEVFRADNPLYNHDKFFVACISGKGI